MLGLTGRGACAAFAVLLVLCVSGVSRAIVPVTVEQATEADFSEGVTEGTRVTNTGRVALAKRVEDLAEGGEAFSSVFDVLFSGDLTLVCVAAGPSGYFHLAVGEEPVAVGGVEEAEQVFALCDVGGKRLVGVSGEGTSRLAWETAGADGGVVLETVVELEGVRYVWDIVAVSAELVAVATGTEGRVLLVNLAAGEDEPLVLLETEQPNALCLATSRDGKTVYVGTDGDGLVYRVTGLDAAGPEVYVMYDAGEPEVASLLALEDSSLLVGTADAEQAKPGRLEEAVSESEGEVEGEGVVEEASEAAVEAEADEPAEAVAVEEEVNEEEVVEDVAVVEPDVVEVTDEQRDRLRDALRERLLVARERGELKTGGLASKGGEKKSEGRRPRPASAASQEEGNAVYRITPDGFVETLLRESTTMLSLSEEDGVVTVGTGNEGQVFRVVMATLEVSVLADFESEQVSWMAGMGEGRFVMGLSNPSRVVSVGTEPEMRGTFESSVIDAGQISFWGSGRLRVLLPASSSVTFETRSGNVADPDSGRWSSWSSPLGLMPHETVPAAVPREVSITSPPARFLQYRVTLIGDGEALPELDAVEVTHVMPNLAPRIATVSVEVPEVGGPEEEVASEYGVSWEANDPNGDRLEYVVELQRAGSTVWLKGAEDVTETEFAWPVNRVPDGWYRVRVTASDLLDNPPDMAKRAKRVSDPVLVDRTAPEVEELAWEAVGGDRIRVSGVAVDGLSPLVGIEYAVDGGEAYRPIVPEDLILDSTREAFSVTLRGFTGSEHVLTLRVVDRRGNAKLIPLIIKMNPAADG
ncbi:hypothetical protein [Mucisphaera calidilacus]|uniref:Fibronectin type-III domain-containing protein n=1 Tax=Mucisphaera calidilacus TaxID=2527982 RepID=A0A518BXY2_9BACT|nr:hypothetical protein [Mucisphaera calidilacus]QDU71818.1 hypothetical protein Pan265_16710 [Mucisphaera calidilacus]